MGIRGFAGGSKVQIPDQNADEQDPQTPQNRLNVGHRVQSSSRKREVESGPEGCVFRGLFHVEQWGLAEGDGLQRVPFESLWREVKRNEVVAVALDSGRREVRRLFCHIRLYTAERLLTKMG